MRLIPCSMSMRHRCDGMTPARSRSSGRRSFRGSASPRIGEEHDDSSSLPHGDQMGAEFSYPEGGSSIVAEPASRFAKVLHLNGLAYRHYLSPVSTTELSDPRLLGRAVKRIVYDAGTIGRRVREL